nr:MAG TPA: hypothetical protein [Caudoviricetes sp.]
MKMVLLLKSIIVFMKQHKLLKEMKSLLKMLQIEKA